MPSLAKRKQKYMDSDGSLYELTVRERHGGLRIEKKTFRVTFMTSKPITTYIHPGGICKTAFLVETRYLPRLLQRILLFF